MKPNDLADLASRIREGDQTAFTTVHQLYKTQLSFYIKKRIKEWHDIEDIISDTFLSLWQSRQKMRSEDHVRNFLFLTARNKALDHLKSKERRSRLLQGIDTPKTTDEDILAYELIRLEMLTSLNEAVNQLPADFRKVFELSFRMELSPAEIARILNIKPATVRSQKSRALELIRKFIRQKAVLTQLLIGLLVSRLTISLKKILFFGNDW